MKNLLQKSITPIVFFVLFFGFTKDAKPPLAVHKILTEKETTNTPAPHLHGASGTYCSVLPHPYPSILEQPDGTNFQALIIQDGHVIYLETLDGYTILQDRADQFYKYASRGTKGDLFLTAGQVSDIDSRPQGVQALLQVLQPHLRFKGSRLQELEAANQLKNLIGPDDGTSGIFPATGIQRSLLILIDFPDQLATFPTGDFDNMANLAGYNVNGSTGSFKDYYEDVSYGLLTINTDVVGWYTAMNNRATYGVQDMSNRNFAVAVPLIREAVDAAEADGIDFSLYDGDNDGSVDVIEVIHSGRGAEESGNVADIWSHRWALSAQGLAVTYDGKFINDYIIQPEKYGAANIANIGVFVHEFGHALGLPDLYDTDGSSNGLGRWCTMAGGTWNNSGKTPAQLSAWCKEELGWITPVLLNGSGTVNNMDFSNSSGDAYRMNTPVNAEYFLLENRQQSGWDQYIPGNGLCIYHIDDSRSNNTDENRYKVNLEQADGNNNLNNNNNSGDTGDPFPGSTNNSSFSCNTSPNTNNYNLNSSNIDIGNIAIAANLASFDYDFCNTNCAILGISINTAPFNVTGTTYDVELTIGYGFEPATGTLDVTANGMLFQFPIGVSPQNVTLTNLPTDGNPVNVTAEFSAEPTCQATANALFTAPFSCNNDNVCDALDITAYINDINGIDCHNLNASTEINEPAPSSGICNAQNGWCENNLSNTVWYQFTAPASGSIDIDFATAIDMQMAVWEADNCNDMLNSSLVIMVAANDDDGSAGGYSPRITNLSCLIPDKTYYIQIDGWNGTTGSFTIIISDPLLACTTAPISGDGCANNFTATSTGNGEWIHIPDGSGNIIASVNDKFNNLGVITADFSLNSGALRMNNNNYSILDRDWFITVANNNAACIRLYLTDIELQALVAAGGISQLADLHLSKINAAACNDFNGVETFVTQSASKVGFNGTNHMVEFNISGFSGFFPRGNTAILPVELTEFRGITQKGFNQLKWVTAAEFNVNQFMIQKLNPSKEKWENVGTVKADGFSQQTRYYSWEDKALLPLAYYRLKILDLDDSFEYSDVIALQRTDMAPHIVRAFPSPVDEILTVEWISSENNFAQMEILNLSGQLMQQQQIEGRKGLNSFQLNVSSFPAGIYLFSIQSNDRSVIRKIVVK